MRYIILIFILILFVFRINAQTIETNPDLLRTKNWIFGDKLWLVFEKDSIVQKTSELYNWLEGPSNLTDKDGNLIFYTGYNSLLSPSKIIMNGESMIFEFSSTQGSIIIPYQNDSSFILISNSNYSDNNVKCFSTIGKINNDTITITKKNIPLFNNCTEKLNAINAANNYDVWISTHTYKSDTFYSFKINHKTGLMCCPTITKNGTILTGPSSQGQFKFSSDGKLAASCDMYNGIISLYKFDAALGILFNKIAELPNSLPYGVEFSIDGDLLFCSDNKGNIIKYDITELNENKIIASKKMLGNFDNHQINALQILNKNNILFAQPKSNKIGSIVINDTSVKLDYDFITLVNEDCLYGLPNFNQSYFRTPSIDFAFVEDCVAHNYSFEGRDSFGADVHSWQFTKKTKTESKTGKNINHTFSDTGIWTVTYFARKDNRTFNVSKDITIYPKWKTNPLGNDTFFCASQSLTLLAPSNMYCVHWNGEEPNYDENSGPIIEYYHFHKDSFVVTKAGNYSIKLTNQSFCQFWDTLKVEEKPKPAKPNISFNTGELASTLVAKEYYWYLNDTFLFKTTQRSFKPNKNGYYQLKIISEFGCESDKSDSLWLDLSSIKQYSLLSFELFPNPSNGYLQISFLKTDKYFIEVIDHLGNIVISVKTDEKQTSLDLTSISKGNYIIRISDSSGNNGSKMIFLN